MDAGACGGCVNTRGCSHKERLSPHVRRNLYFTVFKILGRERREDGRYKKQPRGGGDPRKTSENQMRRGRGRQEGEKRRLNRGQRSE